MPIQSGKYVTPAWQNGGSPAITAEELTAIGQSIEQNQDDIEQNATDIQTANNNIQTANNNIQQNAQDIESLQTWQSTVNGQISSIQSGYLQKSGGTMTGALNMGNKRITNLSTPSSGTDAANKNYIDNNFLSQMTLVQTETFTASANKTQRYTFNSSFCNLTTSYQIMIIAISGNAFNLGSNGNIRIFGDLIMYSGDTNSYVINASSPIIILFAKYGLTVSEGICYCGLLRASEDNTITVADKSGNASTFPVALANAESNVSVNLTIKLYGWNPI